LLQKGILALALNLRPIDLTKTPSRRLESFKVYFALFGKPSTLTGLQLPSVVSQVQQGHAYLFHRGRADLVQRGYQAGSIFFFKLPDENCHEFKILFLRGSSTRVMAPTNN